MASTRSTSDGKLNTDGPEAIAAAEMYQKLVRELGPPGVAGFNWYECQALYMQGKAAMWIDTSAVGSVTADPAKSKMAANAGFVAHAGGPESASRTRIPIRDGCRRSEPQAGARLVLYVQWATGKANAGASARRRLWGSGGRTSANARAKKSTEAKTQHANGSTQSSSPARSPIRCCPISWPAASSATFSAWR